MDGYIFQQVLEIGWKQVQLIQYIYPLLHPCFFHRNPCQLIPGRRLALVLQAAAQLPTLLEVRCHSKAAAERVGGRHQWAETIVLIRKKKEQNTGVTIFLLTDWAMLNLLPKKKWYGHKLNLKYVNSWKISQLRKPT